MELDFGLKKEEAGSNDLTTCAHQTPYQLMRFIQTCYRLRDLTATIQPLQRLQDSLQPLPGDPVELFFHGEHADFLTTDTDRAVEVSLTKGVI